MIRGPVALVAAAALAACSTPGETDSTLPSVEPSNSLIQRALTTHLPDTDGRFVGAAVLVDVPTGNVVAFESSAESSLGILTQQRPSGSTFKLIVDVALAEVGVSAADGVLVGSGCAFSDGVLTTPSSQEAAISIDLATANSNNCAFGKLARAVGPDRLGQVSRAVGLERSLDLGTRFGLGGNTVSLEELADVARSIVLSGEPGSDLRADTYERVREMTIGVTSTGTAAGAALENHSTVAKTGTSAHSADAWFVGATRSYAMAVWVGNPNQPSDPMVQGAVPGYDAVHGGDIPALIWHDVMNVLHREIPPDAPVQSSSRRQPVIVIDSSTDCRNEPELIRNGPPGPDITWIATGGPVQC